MSTINPKDIENIAKKCFDENFKRQAMQFRGVPKDVLFEYIIGGKKYTESLRDFETANGVKVSFRKQRGNESKK